MNLENWPWYGMFIGVALLVIGTPRSLLLSKPELSVLASLVTKILVTVLVLLSALFIIVSNSYPVTDQKWAYGVIGTIIGYWFKAAAKRPS
jgi:hypothetical protein